MWRRSKKRNMTHMSKNSDEKCLSLWHRCVKWFRTNVGKSWKTGWKKCDEGMIKIFSTMKIVYFLNKTKYQKKLQILQMFLVYQFLVLRSKLFELMCSTGKLLNLSTQNVREEGLLCYFLSELWFLWICTFEKKHFFARNVETSYCSTATRKARIDTL